MDLIPILLGSLPLAHNAQHSLVMVASVPGLPRSVRVLIMRMRKRLKAENIRRTGKAWAETSREGRRGVDAWWAWQAKSKTMVCWVRSRPLLPTARMVSLSFSTIDYKSLTYARGFAAYNRFPSGQK